MKLQALNSQSHFLDLRRVTNFMRIAWGIFLGVLALRGFLPLRAGFRFHVGLLLYAGLLFYVEL